MGGEKFPAPAAPPRNSPKPTAINRTAETQQPGPSQQPKGQGQKGSRTKKGAWGETADAEPNAAAVDAGEDAEPAGRAADEGNVAPGAAAQQPGVPLHRHRQIGRAHV